MYEQFGAAGGEQFERFIIVINCSDFEQFVDIPFSVNGAWDDLLNEQSVIVENFRLSNQRIDSNWGGSISIRNKS